MFDSKANIFGIWESGKRELCPHMQAQQWDGDVGMHNCYFPRLSYP